MFTMQYNNIPYTWSHRYRYHLVTFTYYVLSHKYIIEYRNGIIVYR